MDEKQKNELKTPKDGAFLTESLYQDIELLSADAKGKHISLVGR